mmetsp:Transcript_52441/g.78351  ORF Transcript_52441/g.78351 Transcript_52441/m.78351 type:complete len:88 (-) Transcript_52441:1365-1628(-)
MSNWGDLMKCMHLCKAVSDAEAATFEAPFPSLPKVQGRNLCHAQTGPSHQDTPKNLVALGYHWLRHSARPTQPNPTLASRPPPERTR